MIQAYHFTADTLRDGRPVPAIGEWFHHDGEIRICRSGLHASRCPLDALQYAPGPFLHGVTCFAVVAEQHDKLVCASRRIDWTLDAAPLLRAFARWCALQAVHLWNAPPVVLEYLTTGREDLRAAARNAARDAARNAPRDAARNAARNAAWAAAWNAAWAATWVATRDAQRTQLLTMIDEARAGRTEWTFEVPEIPK